MVDKEKLIQLVENAQEDINRFDELYEYTVKAVYFWCYERAGNVDLAKDLMQETMVRIARYLRTLEDPDKFLEWAYVVAKNTCKTYHIKNQDSDKVMNVSDETYGKIVSNVQDSTSDYRPDEQFNEKERNELVVEFVNGLPTKQREVITLYYLEEFSINEIASILDTKTPTVKSHLFLGRKNLKKQISEYQDAMGIRLYDLSILPILTGVLVGYREMVCADVDLSFKGGAFFEAVNQLPKKAPAELAANNVLRAASWISNNLVVLIAAGVIVSTMAVGSVFANNKPDPSIKIPSEIKGEGVISGMNDSLIHSITLDKPSTVDGLPVSIRLLKDVKASDIQLSLRGEVIPFQYVDQTILFVARQNGTYLLNINGNSGEFLINSIDNYPPSVTGYTKEEGYIQLQIDDSYSSVDYEKSYIIYSGESYKLTTDNRVYGEFSGDLTVYIYSTKNQFASYNLEIK